MTSISKADDIFYNLNTDFCQNIQRSLYTGISSKDFIPESFEKYNVHKVVADAFASKQWEVRVYPSDVGQSIDSVTPLALSRCTAGATSVCCGRWTITGASTSCSCSNAT